MSGRAYRVDGPIPLALHRRLTALCCDAFQEPLRRLLARPRQRLDEDNVGVWLGFPRVEALYPPRHHFPALNALRGPGESGGGGGGRETWIRPRRAERGVRVEREVEGVRRRETSCRRAFRGWMGHFPRSWRNAFNSDRM